MGTLDGKVAIVTGASRGIGAEIARRFAQEGAAVAVAARTTGPGTSPFDGTIGETVEQIRAAGGTAVAIQTDLSRPGQRMPVECRPGDGSAGRGVETRHQVKQSGLARSRRACQRDAVVRRHHTCHAAHRGERRRS